MKKVLVLAAVLAMTATQALAFSSVVDSAHNLNNVVVSNASQEVCVFCHTPHGADVSNPNAPLWNRQPAGGTYTYYNSATIDAATKGAVVSDSIAGSDAPLCMSCHDGAAAVTTALLNEPNGFAPINYGTYTWGSASANITTDLSNDHPIGMVYSTVQSNDTAGFFPVGAVTAAGLKFYDGGKMWCSSCHDVHDDSYGAFLAKSNVESNLCLACHNK